MNVFEKRTISLHEPKYSLEIHICLKFYLPKIFIYSVQVDTWAFHFNAASDGHATPAICICKDNHGSLIQQLQTALISFSLMICSCFRFLLQCCWADSVVTQNKGRTIQVMYVRVTHALLWNILLLIILLATKYHLICRKCGSCQNWLLSIILSPAIAKDYRTTSFFMKNRRGAEFHFNMSILFSWFPDTEGSVNTSILWLKMCYLQNYQIKKNLKK